MRPDGEENTLAHEIHRISTCVWFVFALAIAFSNLSAPAQPAPATAFIHVNVVPMDREIVLRDQTVIVKDGKIVASDRLDPSRFQRVVSGLRAPTIT